MHVFMCKPLPLAHVRTSEAETEAVFSKILFQFNGNCWLLLCLYACSASRSFVHSFVWSSPFREAHRKFDSSVFDVLIYFSAFIIVVCECVCVNDFAFFFLASQLKDGSVMKCAYSYYKNFWIRLDVTAEMKQPNKVNALNSDHSVHALIII